MNQNKQITESKNEVDVKCPYVYLSPKEVEAKLPKSFSIFNLFTSKAEAQPINTQNLENSISNISVQAVSAVNNQLTVPFYLFVGSFFLFVFLMAGVFIYHWVKFNLNDPFIKNYILVFFIGLAVLTMPLLFNLINF